MGEFKTRVQREEIHGPLRRKFSRSQWLADFEKYNTDEEDRNLHYVGNEIHQKANAIRSALKITSSALSATTKIRAFVAVSNHNICVLKDKTEQLLAEYAHNLGAHEGKPVMMHEMSALKVRVLGGFEFTPDEITEVSVDGIEVPIRVILNSQESLAGNPQSSKVNWPDVATEANLGGAYSLIEDLWDECLWNDYELKSMQEALAFTPRLEENLASKTASQARGRAYSLQFATMAAQIQSRDLRLQALANAQVAEVTAIVKEGRKQKIVLFKGAASSREHQYLFALRAMASEPYYTELLTEPRAALSGASIGNVLSAWSVLSRCGSVLLASLRSRSFSKANDPGSWLPEFAPTLQREALLKAISTACNFNRAKSAQLLEFFTFRGLEGQELWAQPLLPVSPDSVAPLIAALSSPNLRRLVDVWLRQAGVDLSLRGPAFEIYIRTAIREAIVTSPLLSEHAQVLGREFVFRPPDGRSEQIDVVFRVGNTVFICELKCILEPTDAKGIAMHRKTVHGATQQVQRKVNSVLDNRSAFENQLSAAGFQLHSDFSVHPLVVISGTTHVGTAVNGVPVIDELVLTRFFEGELIDIAIQSPNGMMEVRQKTNFYSERDDAESKALQYFTDPPQMRIYKKGLERRWIPIYPFSETDWSGAMLVFDCVPATPTLETKPSDQAIAT